MLLGEDGCIDVPPEATAKATSIATGRIVFSGIDDGVCRISLDVLHYVRDHSETNGKESEGITPSVIDQIIAQTKSHSDVAKSAAISAENSALKAEEMRDGAEKPLKHTPKFDLEPGGYTTRCKVSIWIPAYPLLAPKPVLEEATNEDIDNIFRELGLRKSEILIMATKWVSLDKLRLCNQQKYTRCCKGKLTKWTARAFPPMT